MRRNRVQAHAGRELTRTGPIPETMLLLKKLTRAQILIASLVLVGVLVASFLTVGATVARAQSAATGQKIEGSTGKLSAALTATSGIVSKAKTNQHAEAVLAEANQVIAEVQTKVDTTPLATSIASLASYATTDEETVLALASTTQATSAEMRAAAAEADRVAAEAAAAAQAAAASAQAAANTPDGARATARASPSPRMAGVKTSSPASTSYGRKSQAGPCTRSTLQAVPPASRRHFREARWLRPEATGRPTHPPRLPGASTTSTARTARRAQPGHILRL